jgi:hypothetical protein
MKKLEKEVDNMNKEEVLLKIKEMIDSNQYDIETILNIVPEELLNDVVMMLQNYVQQESDEIKEEMSDKKIK